VSQGVPNNKPLLAQCVGAARTREFEPWFHSPAASPPLISKTFIPIEASRKAPEGEVSTRHVGIAKVTELLAIEEGERSIRVVTSDALRYLATVSATIQARRDLPANKRAATGRAQGELYARAQVPPNMT
jgi:hypothetical protein